MGSRVKTGFLSLHTGGDGAQFELTSGKGSQARQPISFGNPRRDGTYTNDKVISFTAPTFNTIPAGAIAVSASVFTTIVPGLVVSGTTYVPLTPYALDHQGKAVSGPLIADANQNTSYGIRVGLWSAQVGGTFLEHVSYVNANTPFTSSAVSNLDFAINSIAVAAH